MTEYSHPVSRCPVATTLYYKWVKVAGKHKPYEQPFKGAKADYQLHVYDSECRRCKNED